MIERLKRVAAIQIDDSQVAVGLGHVIAGRDCLEVKLNGVHISLFMQQQCLFEWGQQARDLATLSSEQTQLPLQLGFNLLNGQALRTHLADPPEECQSLKIITKLIALWSRQTLNNPRVRPAANCALAQTK